MASGRPSDQGGQDNDGQLSGATGADARSQGSGVRRSTASRVQGQGLENQARSEEGIRLSLAEGSIAAKEGGVSGALCRLVGHRTRDSCARPAVGSAGIRSFLLRPEAGRAHPERARENSGAAALRLLVDRPGALVPAVHSSPFGSSGSLGFPKALMEARRKCSGTRGNEKQADT